MSQAVVLDYSLTGVDSAKAIEKGLAEAEWYTSPVPKADMRQLLERRDGPAIRDTIIWFGLLIGFAALTCYLWPTPWAILPLLCYAVIYGSTSDSRWHEAGHGTAFKTDWMNNALYEIASFMVMREALIWRWSHNRHHSDTIIVGRDPEIAVPRPPSLWNFFSSFFNWGATKAYFRTLIIHSFGQLTAAEKTFVPASEHHKVIFRARIYASIYLAAIALSIAMHSILPLMFIGLPNLIGSWLMPIYGLTQHTGLAENVLDHRLNCRTVYMNPINRYLYWNMNYHVEHHMFPLVPYHALPRLHDLVKDDMPVPYRSIAHAWGELFPAVLKQRKDPAYHVKRQLPPPKPKTESITVSTTKPDADGWVQVCPASQLKLDDVIRFDQGKKTFAIYRDAQGKFFATDGICTHGNAHLADGLVKDGIIECPKHNGRFNLLDGSPARTPICRGLCTYPVDVRNETIYLQPGKPGGSGARPSKTLTLKVVSNRSVATFIRELILEPVDADAKVTFEPGDYLQFEIPTFDRIPFRDFDIPQPYASVWEAQHVFDLVATNLSGPKRNNYSLACNHKHEKLVRLNVRIATPPPGQDCPPGAGSAYMFSLKPGQTISCIGPFGDFHVKPTQREMLYIGGGSGMAPLRAHLSHLFETERTLRKVSFWYGARSRQEIFYQDYFEQIAAQHNQFSYHLALSSPLPQDHWTGHTGFIHEVVLQQYLNHHPNPRAVEYYLCGPPMMIQACTKMLTTLGVPSSQIAFDEF